VKSDAFAWAAAVTAWISYNTATTSHHDDTHASHGTKTLLEAPPKHGTLTDLAPLSPIRIFRPNPHLEIAFDVRTRNPVYVLEHLVIASSSSAPKQRRPRRPRFVEETQLPVAYRSRNAAYHGSGYDRGHLAPAADFASSSAAAKSNQRFWNVLQQDDDDSNSDYYKDTFTLCNVSPQVHTMNRRIWSRLEDWVRTMARKHMDTCDCYVLTGPLWLPARRVEVSAQVPHNNVLMDEADEEDDDASDSDDDSDYSDASRAIVDPSKDQRRSQKPYFMYEYPAIGDPPNVIAVPTHFFKVVVLVSRHSSCIERFACFVVANQEELPSYAETQRRTLQDHVVRWTDLEAVSGLTLFPTLASEEWKQSADQVTSFLELTNDKRKNNNTTLLLNNGSEGEHDKKQQKALVLWKKQQSSSNLHHLCEDQACEWNRAKRK
jgi:endonuclease G, mitochondrial